MKSRQTNVADDGVVAHVLNVAGVDDALAAGGRDEDVRLLAGLLHGGHLETLHGSLESVDGIDLGDEDASAEGTESLGASLADITIASNDSDLASNHDIGGTLDAINERLAATIEVVELALGDTVVDVDGGDLQGARLHHLVEIVHTGGGLLGDTLDRERMKWKKGVPTKIKKTKPISKTRI